MKNIYFTVGPSQIYPTLAVHMRQALMEEIPSISHRGKEFRELYRKVDKNLRRLLGIPETHHIFFLGSGLEGIERTIQSCVLEKSFHFVSGAFSRKAMSIAEELGKKPIAMKAQEGLGFSIDTTDIPEDIELIFITENDTSIGTRFPMIDVSELKERYKQKLIALDVVSSVPYTKIDFKAVDIAIFSVQKGFGLPAGLGITIVSDKALVKAKKIQRLQSIGSYHSFISLAKAAEDFQTPETPNVLDIRFLKKITDEMLYRGVRDIRKSTEDKAVMLYKFFDVHPRYRPFISDESIRSLTTIVIDVDGEGERVRNQLAERGIIVGEGYGGQKNQQIRIGNFPAHTVGDVKKLISIFKTLD